MSFYDAKRRPIQPGDLLRTFHFRAARRREKWFLYHVAVVRDGRLWMVPVHELEPSMEGRGGACVMRQGFLEFTEIIAGFGPKPHLTFKDRPRFAEQEGEA